VITHCSGKVTDKEAFVITNLSVTLQLGLARYLHITIKTCVSEQNVSRDQFRSVKSSNCAFNTVLSKCMNKRHQCLTSGSKLSANLVTQCLLQTAWMDNPAENQTSCWRPPQCVPNRFQTWQMYKQPGHSNDNIRGAIKKFCNSVWCTNDTCKTTTSF